MRNVLKFKLFFAVLGMLVLGALFTNSVFAIDIYIEGEKIACDVAPEIKNGSTFVPLRVISENLGVDVAWDAKTKTVSIKDSGVDMVLKSGDKTVNVYRNEEKIDEFEITAPPYSGQGRTMVPIRAVSQFFGKDVNWNDAEKAVYIADKNSETLQDTVNEGPNVQTAPDEYKNIIVGNMKYIPRINDIFKDYAKHVIVMVQNDGGEIGCVAELNERIPGDYMSFIVADSRSFDGFYSCFYVEKNTKKVYYSQCGGAVFSLPDFKVVTTEYTFNYIKNVDNGTVFENGLGYTEVLRSLMMQKGKVKKDDSLFVKVNNVPDEPEVSLYRGEPSGKKEHICDFVINLRDVILKSTGEKLYDDSKFTNRPEKAIDEKNAGAELIRILKEIKKAPKGEYAITDVKRVEFDDEVDKRTGYKLAVTSGGDTTMYFISETGNVAMQYDSFIGYYYIYGKYTPFG